MQPLSIHNVHVTDTNMTTITKKTGLSSNRKKEVDNDTSAYAWNVNRMQASIDSGSEVVPNFDTDEDFLTWLNA